MATNDDEAVRQRELAWPGSEELVFTGPGYSQIPRVVPMVAALANHLSKKTTIDPGKLYVVLWSYEWNSTGYLEPKDDANLALEMGYSPDRAKRTVNDRMQALADLGLIRTANRGAVRHGRVLLLDPYKVVEDLYAERKSEFPPGWYDHFTSRAQARLRKSPKTPSAGRPRRTRVARGTGAATTPPAEPDGTPGTPPATSKA